MLDSPENFREGATALRNARDWAKERREELIAKANSKFLNTEPSELVSSSKTSVLPPPNNLLHESETSPRVASTQQPQDGAPLGRSAGDRSKS